VVGDGNKPFYTQMAQAGLPPGRLPVVSFTIGEDELRDLPVKEMIGDYAAWSYFQSLDNPINRAFVQRFKEYCGAERTTGDAIVAAYNAVKLWAQTVKEIGSDATAEVRKAIRRQSSNAPEGIVSVDSETLHTWRPFYLGKVRGDGQFDVIWSLEKPVRPVPYPVLRPRAEWEAFVEKLYTTWGTRDFNPQTLTEPPAVAPALARRRLPGAAETSFTAARRTRPTQ
jgi:urea transport system substrate-binding protein